MVVLAETEEKALRCALQIRAQMGTVFSSGKGLCQEQKDIYCSCSGEQFGSLAAAQQAELWNDGVSQPNVLQSNSLSTGEFSHFCVWWGSSVALGCFLDAASLFRGTGLSSENSPHIESICRFVPQKVWPPEEYVLSPHTLKCSIHWVVKYFK